MRYCVVKNCVSWKEKDNIENIKFFTFPKDENLSKIWVKACGKPNINTKTARMCSLHFTDDDWRLKDKLLNIDISKRYLDPKAVPTQMLPDAGKAAPRSIQRNNRILKRCAKKIVMEAIEEYDLSFSSKVQEVANENNAPTEERNPIFIDVQTEFQLDCDRELQIIELNKKLEIMQKEKEQMEEKIIELNNFKNSVQNFFTEGQLKKMLQNPEKKVHWFSKTSCQKTVCNKTINKRS